MTDPMTLGRSDVQVPRLGVGAMTWGDPSGRAKNGRQAANNAGALAFSLSPGEVEALDRATTAWRGDTKGATS